MGIAGVGAVMLALVLIVYLRSINTGPKRGDRERKNDRWMLEQVDALEGFGRHRDAIKLLERALESDPDNEALNIRLDILRNTEK
jgi:tetratricopeptide (TPR) repeat protein